MISMLLYFSILFLLIAKLKHLSAYQTLALRALGSFIGRMGKNTIIYEMN